eukprot:gene12679-14987_t
MDIVVMCAQMQYVNTTGIVTAVNGEVGWVGVWLQDGVHVGSVDTALNLRGLLALSGRSECTRNVMRREKSARYAGIFTTNYVDNTSAIGAHNLTVADLPRGTVVLVNAMVQEVHMWHLENSHQWVTVLERVVDMVVIGEAAEPAPLRGSAMCQVASGVFAENCTEELNAYEGVLVVLENVTVTQAPRKSGGWFYVDDGSGEAAAWDDLNLGLGAVIPSLTGVAGPGNCTAEENSYSGVLVVLLNLTVTRAPEQYEGWFYVDDGSGEAAVGYDVGYHAWNSLGLAVGVHIPSLTAVAGAGYISPRDEDDVLSFEAEYIEAMAKEAGVPSADVVIASLMPGSVVVMAEVEFRGEVEVQHVDSFVAALDNTSSSIFDADFTSKYGTSTVLNVSTEYEPSSPPPPLPPLLPSPSPGSDSDDNASTAGIGAGAIIGIVVGVFVIVMCSVFGYFGYMRKRSAPLDSTQGGDEHPKSLRESEESTSIRRVYAHPKSLRASEESSSIRRDYEHPKSLRASEESMRIRRVYEHLKRL